MLPLPPQKLICYTQFQQMRLLLQAQRHLQNESNAVRLPTVARTCHEVLGMATMGGAEAVGLKDVIGSITPGKKADILITRCDSTRMTPVLDPVAALVLYANGSDIDTVFVNGEMVKHQGILTGVDWPKTRGQLRKSAESIMERSKKAPIDTIKEEVGKQIDVFATRLQDAE